MTSLRIDSVSASYGPVRALSNVSLEVDEGSVWAVLGANGAGKSSLTRVIAGLVAASSGQVHFEGRDITHLAASARRRLGLAVIPEQRGIFPSLTVSENLQLAFTAVVGKKDAPAKADEAYEMFPALRGRERQIAGSLSGGEQQMLALARVLGAAPKVIIADELSHGLAPKLVDAAFEVLGKARGAGTTLIVVEQFIHRALALADHCAVMRKGTIVWTGPASEAGQDVMDYYWSADADQDARGL